MAREGFKATKRTHANETQIVIERRSLKEIAAIIGMSSIAALGVLVGTVSFADYRAGQRIEEADQAAQNSITQAAKVGDCLLGNSRLVSAEASQRFIADANQKASELLDDKVAKPLEGATGPLTDISRAVSTTTTTTEAATTTTIDQAPKPASPSVHEESSQPGEITTTTMSIPAQLPECSAVAG